MAKQTKLDEAEEERQAKENAARDAERRAKEKAMPKDEDAGEEAANPSQLQPYPTGNPPDPEDEFEKVHGFRRDGKTKE